MLRRVIAITVLATAMIATFFMVSAARGFDFNAFYCAGKVAREGNNPYRTVPLHECEQFETDPSLMKLMHGATLPAPFPGYVIAAMEPISQMPFRKAVRVWTWTLVTVTVASMVLLMRLTCFSAPFIAASLCLSIGIPSLGFGEFVPVFIFALCLSAVSIREGRYAIAAVAAVACLVQPHLGLPICLSLFLWLPRTRIPLLAGAIVFGLTSIAALGIRENLEYFTRVLPYHALSEIGVNRQFSLSVIIHALRGNDELALRVGFYSYAIMAGAGIWLAQRAARHFGDCAFLVTVPAVGAMIGGSFVHISQIAAALPLALMLLAAAPKYRKILLPAAIMLAIPWMWIFPAAIILALIFVFYLAWEGTSQNLAVTCAYVAAAFLLVAGLNFLSSGQVPNGPGVPVTALAIPPQYPEASWAYANLAYWSSGNAASWASRAPTWCGLLMIFGVVFWLTRSRAMILEPA